jgi:hypothetical protein
MLVDLFREPLCDSRHRERVFHTAHIRVGGGHEIIVGVYRIVVMDLVSELVAKLGKETALDEDRGASVDSCFALRNLVGLV